MEKTKPHSKLELEADILELLLDCLAVEFTALTERPYSKVFKMYEYGIMSSVRTPTACGGE